MARKKWYKFSATVLGVDSKGRFLLDDVWNINHGRIFRDHVWVKWKSNHKPKIGDTIIFRAKINWYTKSNGVRKRGLIRPNIIKRTRL